ncbi:hypothetical protein [Prevotella sp.]
MLAVFSFESFAGIADRKLSFCFSFINVKMCISHYAIAMITEHRSTAIQKVVCG